MVFSENPLVTISNPVKLHFSDESKYRNMQSHLSAFRGRMISNFVRHTALDNTLRKVWYSMINSLIRFFTRERNMPKYYQFRAFVAQKEMAKLSRNRLLQMYYHEKNEKLKTEIATIVEPTEREEKENLLKNRVKNKKRIIKEEEWVPYMQQRDSVVANIKQYTKWNRIAYLQHQLVDATDDDYEKIKELLSSEYEVVENDEDMDENALAFREKLRLKFESLASFEKAEFKPFIDEEFIQSYLTNEDQSKALEDLQKAVKYLHEECEAEITAFKAVKDATLRGILLQRIEQIEQSVEDGLASESIAASRLNVLTQLFNQAIEGYDNSINYRYARQAAHNLAEPGCLVIEDEASLFAQEESEEIKEEGLEEEAAAVTESASSTIDDDIMYSLEDTQCNYISLE